MNMKRTILILLVSLASMPYIFAQEWNAYYVVEEVGQKEASAYWFKIDWKNKLYFLDSDSEDETKGVMKNYKEEGKKKSFDVHYPASAGIKEKLWSIEFTTEEGEDKYSIVQTLPNGHKAKFILSTQEPKKDSDNSVPGKVKSAKEDIKKGVNNALKKINVFKKKK